MVMLSDGLKLTNNKRSSNWETSVRTLELMPGCDQSAWWWC